MAGLPLGRSAQLDRTAGHAAATATFAERSRAAGARLSGIREIGILSALILIGVCLSFATPYFLTGTNLLNISRQMATIAIIAVGMTYLIISREFDLSVGSTYGLAGVVTGLLVLRQGFDVWLALPLVLALGLLVGLVNGLMVTVVGIPSFIITLGTLSVLRGAALVLSNGWPVSDGKNVHEVVADEHDGVAGLPELHDELEHELLLLDAEGSGWLIEDHDAAVLRHRSADRDRLALAAGEVADQRMDGGDADAELGERLFRLGRHPAVVDG